MQVVAQFGGERGILYFAEGPPPRWTPTLKRICRELDILKRLVAVHVVATLVVFVKVVILVG
jgi:hypothetical protein